MQGHKIFKLIIDTNKDACCATWNVLNNFQEKSDEMIKFAFEKSHLPQAAKDLVLKSFDAYQFIFKQVLDISIIGYENVIKTAASSREKAEQKIREDFERRLLQRYPHIILSL